MGHAEQFDKYFKIYSKRFFGEAFDWRWFKAQAIAESSLDRFAVSPEGAQGLMQLMPLTSAMMARKFGSYNIPFDPGSNIKLGIAYDQRCFDIWGKEEGIERIRFMLASYNAGPGHIINAQRKAAVSDSWESVAKVLPMITGGDNASETIDYVKRVEHYFNQII